MKKKIARFNIDSLPSDGVVEIICEEYAISPAEFNSTFKYHPLPEARQLYCLALLSFGAKNRDICELTGYDPGRVSYTVNAGQKAMDELPVFKKRHDHLLKIFQSFPV